MTALSGLSTAASATSAASTAASGIGKWGMVAAGLQAISGVGQGVAQMRASSQEAGLLEQQANQSLYEGRLAAESKALDVRRFAADQIAGYAVSGLTGEGSPALVLAETRRLGKQEVDALKRRAEFQAKMLNTQAMRTKAAGRNAFFAALSGAGTGLLGNYAKYKGSTSTVSKTPYSGQRIGISGQLEPIPY